MRQFGKTKFLLQLIPRKKFDALVEKWEMDYRVTKFTTWEQVVTHVMAYVLLHTAQIELQWNTIFPQSPYSHSRQFRRQPYRPDKALGVLECPRYLGYFQ